MGIDEPLAIEQKDKVYYYHADGLGSITALTNMKGKVVQEYKYDSFGNMKRHGHKVKQPYTFTGREYDKETGLYYYRARYYDPKIGRFVSFDPILHPANGQSISSSCGQVQNIFIPSFWSLKENPQNLHPYVYVRNNPINWIDPYGLYTWPYTWRGWTGVIVGGVGLLLRNPPLIIIGGGLALWDWIDQINKAKKKGEELSKQYEEIRKDELERIKELSEDIDRVQSREKQCEPRGENGR